jgi:hypothetical protein
MTDLANDPKYQIQIKHNNANDRFSKWPQIPNDRFKSPNDRFKKRLKMTDLNPTKTKWKI